MEGRQEVNADVKGETRDELADVDLVADVDSRHEGDWNLGGDPDDPMPLDDEESINSDPIRENGWGGR